MLVMTDITATIRAAKLYSSEILKKIDELEVNGSDADLQKRKLILFTEWTNILEDYYNNNFDENGTIDPIYECLTSTQADALVAKLKSVIYPKKYPLSQWILAEGFWNDSGKWIDSERWYDSVPWTT